jgi:hypothetical protein
MTRYFIRCRILPVDEGYVYVSAVAVPEGAPRQGVIARHHECDSIAAAEDFLEILRDQVATAVVAAGGEVVEDVVKRL